MDVSSYDSRSLSNASAILAREWSRHDLEVARGSSFRLKFQQHHLTANTSINAITYGGAVRIRPVTATTSLLLTVPTAGQARASYATGDILIRPDGCGVIDVRTVYSVSCSEDFAGVVVRIRASRLKPYLRDGRWRGFASLAYIGEQPWQLSHGAHHCLHSITGSYPVDASGASVGLLRRCNPCDPGDHTSFRRRARGGVQHRSNRGMYGAQKITCSHISTCHSP